MKSFSSKNILHFFGIFIGLLLLIFACTNNQMTPVTPSPTITSLSVISGTVGATVIISGANFSTTPANNTVKFNGVVATVSAATAISLTVIVPAGASTGAIEVMVGGLTTTSPTNFTVTVPLPTITSFSPASGAVGATVTITGTNFSATLANNIVKFNGTVATISAATATSLTVKVPTGASSGTISVMVGSATANSASSFTVSTTTTNTPTIVNFSPTIGAAGITVILTGTNFSTISANNTVKFNGVTATVTGAASATNLFVTVPATASTGVIAVTVGGLTGASASNFTVTSTTVAFTNATIKPLFDKYCVGCHASGSSDANRWLYNPANYTTSIKGNISTIYSTVYQTKSMPQGSSLTTTELAAFKAWYDAGYAAN